MNNKPEPTVNVYVRLAVRPPPDGDMEDMRSGIHELLCTAIHEGDAVSWDALGICVTDIEMVGEPS